MNLKAELDMPVLIESGTPITLREMAHFRQTGRLENRSLGTLKTFSAMNEAVAHLSVDGEKKLAVARLQATPNAIFKFVDGQKFSGLQAAQEVTKGTEIGKYFTKIQKRAAEIALEALAQGKINSGDMR